MVEAEVHRVRPEERAWRGAPALDPRLVAVRPLQVVLRLLGQQPVRGRVRVEPPQAGVGTVRPREAEHRRQEQPLAAAVVLVFGVPPDAPAGGDERILDQVHELRPADEEERAVEPVVCARERLAANLVRAEAVPDAPERDGVDAGPFFPPVDARLAPDPLEPAGDVAGRLVPARAPASAERAEEEAPAVDLPRRP